MMRSDTRLFDEHARLGVMQAVCVFRVTEGYVLTWQSDAVRHELHTWDGQLKVYKSLDTLSAYLRKNGVKVWTVDEYPSKQTSFI